MAKSDKQLAEAVYEAADKLCKALDAAGEASLRLSNIKFSASTFMQLGRNDVRYTNWHHDIVVARDHVLERA